MGKYKLPRGPLFKRALFEADFNLKAVAEKYGATYNAASSMMHRLGISGPGRGSNKTKLIPALCKTCKFRRPCRIKRYKHGQFTYRPTANCAICHHRITRERRRGYARKRRGVIPAVPDLRRKYALKLGHFGTIAPEDRP